MRVGGFTLIEMLVVVAIAGIATSMAVVSIVDASSVAKTQAESRAVADAFVTGRNLARSLHRCVRVDLTSTQQIDLRVFNSCPAGVPTGAASSFDKTFKFDKRILVDTITTPSGNPLIYDARGSPLELAPTVVNILGLGGTSVTYEILPGIGQVRKR